MREEALIRRIQNISDSYDFQKPLAIYLKEYFRVHPKMGARDRRETREWCFNLMRIGENLPELEFSQRLAVACYLCSQKSYPSLSYLLATHSPFIESELELPIQKKMENVSFRFSGFSPEKIFPMFSELSTEIDSNDWYISFLKKPSVFIRMRKNFAETVKKELNKKGIVFRTVENPSALMFDQDTGLDKLESYSKGYFEIQDLSSQQSSSFFQPKSKEIWWDACAGSGGKSLALTEEDRSIKIIATDSRENILMSYKERMNKTRFTNFETKIADVSKPLVNFAGNFDGIIADVPCSGSGTWSRSPEWLKKDLKSSLKEHYVPLQRKIIMNLFQYLKPEHPLIYITCSVFSAENEENIDFFLKNLPLRLEKSAYLEGYRSEGDTLFAARLIRIS